MFFYRHGAGASLTITVKDQGMVTDTLMCETAIDLSSHSFGRTSMEIEVAPQGKLYIEWLWLPCVAAFADLDAEAATAAAEGLAAEIAKE